MTWDLEGRVATTVDGSGESSYVYDADGNRLVKRDPTGRTLYLPGQELRYTVASGAKTCTRYYTHAGQTVAMRTSTGLTWMSSDQHGTAQITINALNQSVSTRRTLPFGEVRGGTGTWPARLDKGFVGGTLDNTGLTHIGAREYDPALGRFISVDPVMDTADPQQWNAYSYSNNSPVTFSDPTGLWCDMCNDGNGWSTEHGDEDPKSDPAPGPTMDWILENYQATKDPRGTYRVEFKYLSRFMEPVELVQAEWDVLIEHACGERIAIQSFDNGGCGLFDTLQFYNTSKMVDKYKKMAEGEAERRYPGESISGGRRDAFRHTYWNMLIAREYGQKFAFDLTVAHERNAIAMDWQEAMDLYNNEQGRLAAKAFENDPLFFESAPHHVQYLVETGQVLAVRQDYNHEKQKWDNFRLVPSNQVPRGYNYNMQAETNTRSGIDPSRLPCGTTVGGRCADR